jgi:hypothetical protein
LGEPSERIDKTDSHPHKSELRGVTLSQYIEYHNNSESRVAFQLDENVGPAFVKKDSSLLEKLGSIFSFGQHIARELDIQGVAHGELKTSTGISQKLILSSCPSFLFNAGEGLENWAFA